MKSHKSFSWYLSIILFLNSFLVYSQEGDSLQGIPKIRQLIANQQLNEAKNQLQSQVATLKAQKNWDSLSRYVEFIGSYSLNNNNWELALQKADHFVEELVQLDRPDVTKYAYKELAWIQDEAGRPDLSLLSLGKALKAAKKGTADKAPQISDIIYNMGYYSSAKGDYTSAKNYYEESLGYYQKANPPDYVTFQQVYNALGGVMWRKGQMDSCNYYFEKSLEALKKTESNPSNDYYRPGLVRMNMAVVSNLLGRNEEAIAYSEEAIQKFNQFMEVSVDEQRINAAKTSKGMAIDNLGVFYNTIGEFQKAEQLVNYSYQQKLKDKSKNDPNVIISKILLTQAKFNTQDMKGAEKLMDEVLLQLEESQGLDSYWRGSAFAARAKIHDFFNEKEKAVQLYQKSEATYYDALEGKYNTDVINNFQDMALFYAKNNYPEKALKIVKNIYKESQREGVYGTPLQLQYQMALAETYYLLKDYGETQHICKEILDKSPTLNLNNVASTDDVVKTLNIPRAILLYVKSTLAQQPNTDKELLKQLFEEVQKGLQLLELRNTFIKNYQDTQSLIAQNAELIDLAKELNYKLYGITENDEYLDSILHLHESSIYNRIRARLNLRDNIKFAKVPEAILKEESQLRKALSYSLDSNDEKSLGKFLQLNHEWNDFLKKLQVQQPDYFQLRYASLLSVPLQYTSNIAPETTWVRYLTISEKLYAIILTKQHKRIVPLEQGKLKEHISQLEKNRLHASEQGANLFELYRILWKPLQPFVNTKKVVVFPDGPLYNLSFEMLTKQPIKDFEDFQAHSLLKEHVFSYNFSLYLTGSQDQPRYFKENYIGFAPAFSSEMKERYQMALADSSNTDQTYLTLLPQPFSAHLIKKSENTFKGKAFYNEGASKQVFLNQASEYKIIHIGTHAESNNVSPELSRLVFAKQVDSLDNQNNYLYTYEIYNYNINADLAVLTACETGKPGYQPGEGMISLAHAFTYAGSESILTSLWEIDEKSSAEIVSLFYENLQKGLSKDEALQQAKITYLAQAKGRSLAPQYWAGLVLMGDTAPIPIDTSVSFLWWIGIAIFLFLLWLLLRKKF